jgi:hypothetical protein
MAARDSINRRALLRLAGAAAMFAAAPRVFAGESEIAKTIEQTRAIAPLSRRIAAVSQAFLGRRYRGDTLIGGQFKPEVFVVRDDVFDCVTYCETVLAAAKAGGVADFERELRLIRYHNGAVAWRERNHDFAAWCGRNVENGTCAPVQLGASVAIKKVMSYPAALGRRSYTIAATTRGALIGEKARLQSGDIIGFVSRHPLLDYYHCGFVMFDDRGELMLRHASQSHRRVIDEKMQSFLAVNRVAYVTVLRPQDKIA